MSKAIAAILAASMAMYSAQPLKASSVFRDRKFQEQLGILLREYGATPSMLSLPSFEGPNGAKNLDDYKQSVFPNPSSREALLDPAFNCFWQGGTFSNLTRQSSTENAPIAAALRSLRGLGPLLYLAGAERASKHFQDLGLPLTQRKLEQILADAQHCRQENETDLFIGLQALSFEVASRAPQTASLLRQAQRQTRQKKSLTLDVLSNISVALLAQARYTGNNYLFFAARGAYPLYLATHELVSSLHLPLPLDYFKFTSREKIMDALLATPDFLLACSIPSPQKTIDFRLLRELRRRHSRRELNVSQLEQYRQYCQQLNETYQNPTFRAAALQVLKDQFLEQRCDWKGDNSAREVLVVDDWITTGGTAKFTQTLFRSLGVRNVKFTAILDEEGLVPLEDLAAQKILDQGWRDILEVHDRQEAIGINYVIDQQQPNDSYRTLLQERPYGSTCYQMEQQPQVDLEYAKLVACFPEISSSRSLYSELQKNISRYSRDGNYEQAQASILCLVAAETEEIIRSAVSQMLKTIDAKALREDLMTGRQSSLVQELAGLYVNLRYS